MLRKLIAILFAVGICAVQAVPAFACGGLVAPNGSIRLSRATTLVEWHNGIEHYMTSFTYQGDVSNLGWIVPLPAVPLKIEEGGAWTLQRLFRETHPVFFKSDALAPQAAGASNDGVQVLQQVKVEALNITVLKGSGQAVLDWASQNNFVLNDEIREHILTYANGSPIFMAAKYDVAAARARGQLQGDGAPVLITMKTPSIWVPLDILAIEGQRVQADIYLLTDGPVNTSDLNAKIGQSAVSSTIPGASDMVLSFQEKMTPALFHDLSTDRNMGWVRSDSWLTLLSLDAPEPAVKYDMTVSTNNIIHIVPFGTSPVTLAKQVSSKELPSWIPGMPLGTPSAALTIAFLLAIGSMLFWFFSKRKRSRVKA